MTTGSLKSAPLISGAKSLEPLVLIVDDEPDFSFLLKEWLKTKNLPALTAESPEEALALIATRQPDLILLDILLREYSGIDLVGKVKAEYPDIPIVMVSAYGDTEQIVEAMKAGASDYAQKPVDYPELWEKISALLAMRSSALTRQRLLGTENFSLFIGQGESSMRLLEEVSKVANSNATVLLRGESGVGKSLIAELIHENSPRKSGRLVTLNCTAIPENLLESELFGHEKGAFTGAVRDKIGKFEYADKGTIFLDEIGDLSLELQVKLLRVLQNQEFERVGGLKTFRVDVRVIAATNRDLEKAVQERRFREDLFYRLNVLPVRVPPLRERREDIPNLIAHFLGVYGDKSGKKYKPPSLGIMNELNAYAWPGNVRELQNVIERAVVLATPPEFKRADFTLAGAPTASAPLPEAPTRIIKPSEAENVLSQTLAQEGKPAGFSLKDMEYEQLVEALKQARGNISIAAKQLGIGRNTAYRRLRKYNIELKK